MQECPFLGFSAPPTQLIQQFLVLALEGADAVVCSDEKLEGGTFAVLEIALAEHPGTLLVDYFHRTGTIFCHLDITSKQYYKPSSLHTARYHPLLQPKLFSTLPLPSFTPFPLAFRPIFLLFKFNSVGNTTKEHPG